MDRRERWEDYEEAFHAAFDGRQANIWTSLPGIIVDFNPKQMTATVQPAVQECARQRDDTYAHYTLTQCLDVPVHFPAGGGFALTYPVKKGDECLIVFAHRCIDKWWKNGGVRAQSEFRMHDPSDGFAVMGFRSQPRVLPNLSTETTQLRADDGKTYLEVDGHQKVNAVAPSEIHLDSQDKVTVNGKNAVTVTTTGVATIKASEVIHDAALTLLNQVKAKKIDSSGGFFVNGAPVGATGPAGPPGPPGTSASGNLDGGHAGTVYSVSAIDGGHA